LFTIHSSYFLFLFFFLFFLRFVRKLLELDLRDVRVVSYAELLPEVAIRPVAKATLAGL